MPRTTMLRALSRSLPIALLFLGGCGGEGEPKGGELGGTMIVIQPEPKTLFPPKVSGTEGHVIIAALFNRLAEIGPNLQTSGDSTFTPRLAKGWEWGLDSLSLAFSLRPDVRWHDGAPLRAQDVRFTFATYTSDAVGASNQSLLSNIDSVSVRDSLTAVFWFKRRLPHQLFDATYHMFVLPSHLLDTIAPAALGTSAFARNPVGTGRFRFVRWDPGARVEVLADTGNALGRAKLDRVIWTFSSDFGASTVKLFAGEADFYEGIRPNSFPQVEASKQFRLEPYSLLRYDFLGYNLRQRGNDATPHPLFGDVRVRRALAMAVDRAGLARNVYDTLGSVALSAAPRVLIPDTAALRQIPFDPAGARALLDSLGWIVDPKDGIRVRDGVRFSFEIMAQSSSQSRQDFAQLLEQQFRAVGIESRMLTLENKSFIPRVEGRDYDAVVLAWQMNPGRLGMAQTWRSDGSQNYGGYNSPEFDTMLDSAMTSMRIGAYNQRWTAVLQRLIDDQPALWLAEARTPIAIHRRIRTTPLRADGWQAGLADWTVDPNQRIERDGIGLRSAR